MLHAQAVVLKNNVYMDPRPSSRLLIYNINEDLWDILDTPSEDYALTTYHFQLVLVGGVDPDSGKTTNQLWVLDEQDNWTQPLPPMITKRYQASAVSVDDHLIVAGGCGGGYAGTLKLVEVYDGHQWRQVQPLPRACSWMKSAVLEGNWYLAGGMGQDSKVYHTCLESLIASSYAEEAGQTSVWKKLPDAPPQWSTLAVLRNYLIAVGGGYKYSSTAVMHAYFPSMNTWVHVEDIPIACHSPCTLVLPTRELLVVGGKTETELSSHSFRASIRGTWNLPSLRGLHHVLFFGTCSDNTQKWKSSKTREGPG